MNRLNNNAEQHAQQMACGHLVRACEDAITQLDASSYQQDDRPETKERAQEILAQVLSSWRTAMSEIAPVQQPFWGEASLDTWTSDELFTEALTRRASDSPALRRMQELTLKAQLTAHDRE